MTVTPQEIAEALKTIDTTDDSKWTDDGSPRVDVVQALVNDTTVTRRMINEALPGFNRTAPATPEDEQAPSGEVASAGADLEALDASDDAEIDDPTSERALSKEEVRAIMTRRLEDATADVGDCQRAIRTANENLIAAQKRETRLRNDLSRRFPPLSQEESIQQHIAAGHRRMEAEIATLQGDGRSQIDAAMSQTNRRGWNRPQRSVNG